jgi:hypothetical protein
MKKQIIVSMLLSIFAVSCAKEMVTVPIEGTQLKVTFNKGDRIDVDKYSTELILGSKKMRVQLKSIKDSTFPTDLAFLLKAFKENASTKITEKHTLKNGAFGISYTITDAGSVKKNYLFYLKKGSNCYRLTNNEFYNTEMKDFDYIKGVIESIQ